MKLDLFRKPKKEVIGMRIILKFILMK